MPCYLFCTTIIVLNCIWKVVHESMMFSVFIWLKVYSWGSPPHPFQIPFSYSQSIPKNMSLLWLVSMLKIPIDINKNKSGVCPYSCPNHHVYASYIWPPLPSPPLPFKKILTCFVFSFLKLMYAGSKGCDHLKTV